MIFRMEDVSMIILMIQMRSLDTGGPPVQAALDERGNRVSEETRLPEFVTGG